MTRDEHLAWSKRRAVAYLPGSVQDAVMSMLSDLGKHDELKGVAEMMYPIAMFEMMRGTPESVRRFIEGFN